MILSKCTICGSKKSKFGENTKNIILQVSKAINSGTMTLSKCTICGDKKSKFIKTKEANGLLSNLGIRTLVSKIPILRDILF